MASVAGRAGAGTHTTVGGALRQKLHDCAIYVLTGTDGRTRENWHFMLVEQAA